MLIEKVNKSTHNKSTRNRIAINFCLVLASLGKEGKEVNRPSFSQKTLCGAISNEVLTVIREAESKVQPCLSGAGEGAGRGLGACTDMPI